MVKEISNNSAPLKRRLFFLAVLVPFLSGPYLLGLLHPVLFPYYLSISGLIICYYLLKRNYGPGHLNFILFIISSLLAFTVFDVISRPLLKDAVYYRPDEMYLNHWPPMPSLSRYAKNVRYEGVVHGDLGAIAALGSEAGFPDCRQRRSIIFETDSFGFRNDDSTHDKVIDLILLGDSFGVGSGTSQGKIWSALFMEKYGLNTYNLSVPGSPWHEIMNLKMEIKRLKTHKDTVVLWALFGGNDLDDKYEEFVDRADLEILNGPLKRLLVSFSTFRKRSPTRQLLDKFIRRKKRDPIMIMRIINGSITKEQFLDEERVLFYNAYAHNRERSVEDILAHGNYNKFVKAFSEMEKFVREEGLTVAVISIPSKAEVYPWALNGEDPWTVPLESSAFSTVVSDLSRLHGFYFLDLEPFLTGLAKQDYEESGELLWWRDDTHWNSRGHEAAAATVFEELLPRIGRSNEDTPDIGDGSG